MNTKMDYQTMQVGFIGGGNMAQAIATGLLEKGIYTCLLIFFLKIRLRVLGERAYIF